MAGSLQSQDSILPADHYQLKTATVNFLKSHIIRIALGAILGLPAIVLGGSFTTSLIQGKTPSEAIVILGEQLDLLFGRVLTLETEQADTNLEIERLKLENENLRLKTEDVSIQAEQFRANEDQKLRCASLASQINAKENAVKQPFEDKIKPLNDDLRQLSIQKSQAENISIEDSRELKSKIDSLKKQINAISLEMEKEVDILRETPEMEALINELNNILLCA